jgi:hypothetical protein
VATTGGDGVIAVLVDLVSVALLVGVGIAVGVLLNHWWLR